MPTHAQQPCAQKSLAEPSPDRAMNSSGEPTAWLWTKPSLLGVPALPLGGAHLHPKLERTDREHRTRLCQRMGVPVTGQGLPHGAGGALTIRRAAAQRLWLWGVPGNGPLAIAAIGVAADNHVAIPLPTDALQLLQGRRGRGRRPGSGCCCCRHRTPRPQHRTVWEGGTAPAPHPLPRMAHLAAEEMAEHAAGPQVPDDNEAPAVADEDLVGVTGVLLQSLHHLKHPALAGLFGQPDRQKHDEAMMSLPPVGGTDLGALMHAAWIWQCSRIERPHCGAGSRAQGRTVRTEA